MSPMLIQGVGVCAAVAGVASFQCKSRLRILYLQMLASVLWILHFSLLGAFTGAVLNAVHLVRCAIFSFRTSAEEDGAAHNHAFLTMRRIADWRGLPVVWVAVCAAVTAWTWTGWLDLLPFVAMVFSTYATASRSPKMVRLLMLPNDPLWMVYDIVNHSYPGAIMEACVMLSILIGYLRHDRRRA